MIYHILLLVSTYCTGLAPNKTAAQKRNGTGVSVVTSDQELEFDITVKVATYGPAHAQSDKSHH